MKKQKFKLLDQSHSVNELLNSVLEILPTLPESGYKNRLIENLKAFETVLTTISWSVDDVINHIKDSTGKKIGKKKALEILEYMAVSRELTDYDWDTITCAHDELARFNGEIT